MRNPLADRLRPQSIEDMVGQRHLLGEGKALRRIIDSKYSQSAQTNTSASSTAQPLPPLI